MLLSEINRHSFGIEYSWQPWYEREMKFIRSKMGFDPFKITQVIEFLAHLSEQKWLFSSTADVFSSIHCCTRGFHQRCIYLIFFQCIHDASVLLYQSLYVCCTEVDVKKKCIMSCILNAEKENKVHLTAAVYLHQKIWKLETL